jgi:hypothetical protein
MSLDDMQTLRRAMRTALEGTFALCANDIRACFGLPYGPRRIALLRSAREHARQLREIVSATAFLPRETAEANAEDDAARASMLEKLGDLETVLDELNPVLEA